MEDTVCCGSCENRSLLPISLQSPSFRPSGLSPACLLSSKLWKASTGTWAFLALKLGLPPLCPARESTTSEAFRNSAHLLSHSKDLRLQLQWTIHCPATPHRQFSAKWITHLFSHSGSRRPCTLLNFCRMVSGCTEMCQERSKRTGPKGYRADILHRPTYWMQVI